MMSFRHGLPEPGSLVRLTTLHHASWIQAIHAGMTLLLKHLYNQEMTLISQEYALESLAIIHGPSA